MNELNSVCTICYDLLYFMYPRDTLMYHEGQKEGRLQAINKQSEGYVRRRAYFKSAAGRRQTDKDGAQMYSKRSAETYKKNSRQLGS